MDFFYDIARYAYLHNALAACILSGIACGIMGTYVVCRRTVFLAGGITHAAFGGLGIAFYLGLNPIAGALVFAVLSALGIEWAGNRGRSRRARIHVDAEGYRARREESLERLAHKVAGKVVKYRRNVTLEPMNAYERHVIHTALQDTQYITTFSIGTEPNRRVVVSYDRTKQ